jgi:hypothetical protein
MVTGFTERLRGKVDFDFGALCQDGVKSIMVFTCDGAPVNGTTGKNVAGPGALLVRTDAGNTALYQNSGSLSNPTWTSAPMAGVAGLTSGSITGVAIDGSVIGGVTPAAGNFTTVYESSGPHIFDQPVATAKTVSATLTAAELLAGVITANPGGGAAAALQLPLASALDTATAAMGAGGTAMVATDSFDFSVTNVSTNALESASLTTNTGWTLVGDTDIAANSGPTTKSAGWFRATKRGAATWTLYRLA